MCYDGVLVMPKNYAVANEEEMTYIDGGAYLSHNKIVDIVGFCSVNSYTVAALASAIKSSCVYVIGALTASLGVVGTALGALGAAWLSGQATNIASAFVNDLVLFKKGVDITLDFFFCIPYACFTARH